MFWKSKGWGRALGIIFLVLGNVADAIPSVQPYKSLLEIIGSALGIGGVINAAGVQGK